MGCSRSKTVPSTPTGDESDQYGSPGSKDEPYTDDKEAKDTKRKKPDVNCTSSLKNNSRTNQTDGHTSMNKLADDCIDVSQLPDISMFVNNNNLVDSTDLGVNNAKPKLNCPGIGRGIRLAPITPSIESSNKHHLHGRPLQVHPNHSGSGGREEFDTSATDVENLANKLRHVSPTERSSFSNRPTSSSTSPRNSISRTTMKTGIVPDLISSLPLHVTNTDRTNYDSSPISTSRMSYLPSSRSGSARTGSVVTTNALNASFLTSVDGDDDIVGHDTTLELCPFDGSDLESEVDVSYRSISVTPLLRMSADGVLSSVPPDVGPIGTIVEEYEGGFTPRGAAKDLPSNDLIPVPVSRLPHFTPKEIFEHNDRMGKPDWCIYMGKVYDIGRLRRTFDPIVRETRKANKEEKTKMRTTQRQTSQNEPVNMSGMDSDIGSLNNSINKDNVDDEPDLSMWNLRSVQNVLRAGVGRTTVKTLLRPCCVGLLVRDDEARYWEDIRSDVKRLLDDFSRKYASSFSLEYLFLLQRWCAKYRNSDPNKIPLPRGVDLNQEAFPLPDEIAEDPECLREWVARWEPFDHDLPENGYAWDPAETADVDDALGDDTMNIFLSSLRPYLRELPDLDLSIAGEAGWDVIPLDLFANDIMTHEQEVVARSRELRNDLWDVKCMERRRSRLLKYFVNKYEMNINKVGHFLSWADAMKKGEEEFLRLCEP